MGHEVEPGYCSGAVVLLDGTRNVTIEDCRLYGSGTYGVEANYSDYINVKNTEIYECTYGLVKFYSSGNATFRNCNMRDSSGFDMIDLQNVWSILFDDCNITDNVVCYDTNALINSNGDDVKFINCHLKGNSYHNLIFGGADLENCSIKD